MTTLETPLVADPIALARRLWGEPEAALLWSADGSGPSYLTCWAVETSGELDPEPGLTGRALGPEPRAQVPRWIGLLPYESQRSRLESSRAGAGAAAVVDSRPPPHHTDVCWWRYQAVCVVENGRVRVVGDDANAARALYQRLMRPEAPRAGVARLGLRAAGSLDDHRARIDRSLRYIREGDIYQVNMARRIELDVDGDELALLHAMGTVSAPPFGMALKAAGVVSTSPELFLKLEPDGRVATVPIKGTRPRGDGRASDEAYRAQLATSAKEAAELTMVIDIERNDLARVSRVGSVTAGDPYVVQHPTVFHREARVSSILRPEHGRQQLLLATLPSGSITGAPKVRAMQIIAEQEADRRGLYTGALGFIDSAGGMQLSIAIRTLTVRSGEGHYFVGGGIVAQSQVEEEVRETEWKAIQLASRVSTSA